MDLNYNSIHGGKVLKGTVTISGSKNACLPILAAALLSEETCTFYNVPQLTDIAYMLELIRDLGAEVKQVDNHTWSITAEHIATDVSSGFTQQIRASVYLLGALLGRHHKAFVRTAGGCQLGERSIDIHLRAFKTLGASITQLPDATYLYASSLKGATFSMRGPRGSTVTGTANAILAAVLAQGESMILDAAREPEIVSLCLFLKQMGAQIEGIGTTQLRICGVSSLHGADFTIPPDRIEASTFFILGLLLGDTLRIVNAPREALSGFHKILPHGKHCYHWEGQELVVRRVEDLLPFTLHTSPYPGFPTDLQAQIAVLASQIHGVSKIYDPVFPERFAYIDALCRLGMDINTVGYGAIAIKGKKKLKGGEIVATDLRAGAAMCLAALVADGETVIGRADYIDRGYEHFEAKLSALGASIQRETKISFIENTTPQPIIIAVPETESDFRPFSKNSY
ncbi:MAG: UDP-N-acetylglucosamine 1-carboxyvinyltransferase [Puniceicoccales bacterium]|jgi:UDP-N-acetylglucosamine 1-carboxyvinyltransferase|nr:UDP-N-acetylglucosamine 1-carboxyvinyltransferase [Puniceicoccales bacterium]